MLLNVPIRCFSIKEIEQYMCQLKEKISNQPTSDVLLTKKLKSAILDRLNSLTTKLLPYYYPPTSHKTPTHRTLGTH